jgi:hypothetical protein
MVTTKTNRTGPFVVEWLESVPNTSGKLNRAGCKRRFEDLPEAVHFVIQAIPEPSRPTAMIHAAVGPSLQFDEIARRYKDRLYRAVWSHAVRAVKASTAFSKNTIRSMLSVRSRGKSGLVPLHRGFD